MGRVADGTRLPLANGKAAAAALPLANLGTTCADPVASCFGGFAGIAAVDLRSRRSSANLA